MIHVVIMAGGGGTRLWPLSTTSKPKQYMRFNDEKSMIKKTVERVQHIVPPERTWIVTVEEQLDAILAEDLGVPTTNVILEPVGRNTAPCIGLAAYRVGRVDKNAILIILPADHLIEDVEEFQKCVYSGVKAAEATNAVVTIGIKPSRPETGYGYIHATKDEVGPGVVKVSQFKEKPELDVAKRYVAAGDYFWNSGIFIWGATKILNDVENYLPKMYATLGKIGKMDSLKEDWEEYKDLYSSIDPISIDYGVIENTEQVLMVKGTFDWSDVGGYEELYRISKKSKQGNVLQGKVFAQNTKDSYVFSSVERPVAVLGLDNVVIVANENGILVCDKETAQNVRNVSGWLKDEE